MSSAESPTRVLFVCLGNICRSPMAEGVFRHQLHASALAERFQHDSAGLGDWYAGKPPNRQAIATCQAYGVPIEDLRARQVSAADFEVFDLVLAMDRAVLHELRALELALEPAKRRARLALFRDFDPNGTGDVPDPYGGSADGFELVYAMTTRTTVALLADLLDRKDGDGSA